MSDCILFKFPGQQFSLQFVLEDEELSKLHLLDVGLDAINELSSVVQPLSADLQVSYQDRKIEPPVPHWHLVVSPLPAKVTTSPLLINANVSKVPDISIEVLRNWVSKAVEMDSSHPQKNQLNWEVIYFQATRAQIYNKSSFKRQKSLFVKWHKSEFEYPLELRNDGLWVYGPIRERPTQPPFTLKLIHVYDSIALDIFVHWSMWYDVNSPGYDALKQAISRIIDQGWELSFYTPLTDPL